MLKRVTLISIALAGIVPGIGLALSGIWPLALGCAAMGCLWLYGYHRGWEGLASLLLVGFIIPAAIGVGLSGRGRLGASCRGAGAGRVGSASLHKSRGQRGALW